MLKNLLTIIIPCKNEGIGIYDCLNLISKQDFISNTKVIIADISDDEKSIQWLNKAKFDLKNLLDIQIIQGGYPAKARLNGSVFAKTPYILFLDADVMLIHNRVILSSMDRIQSHKNLELLSVPFTTNKKWNWVFRIFDIFQKLSSKLGTPFAIGGFQLWKTEAYWKVGGYNPDELFAEDYSISSKIKSENFELHKIKGIWTSPRRFENKGVLWMFKIMIKSYLNRNNPEFFKKHHNYWA
jgi:glycosyltransferase involved in cell wall biosynthesis